MMASDGNSLKRDHSHHSSTHLSHKGDDDSDHEDGAQDRDVHIADHAHAHSHGAVAPFHPHKHKPRGTGRFIIKNLWEVCCNEIEMEIKEVDAVLKKMGLPSVNYSKRKGYELTEYTVTPFLTTCKSKDFLDFYVFPLLLAALQSLIQFARANRVFQCRYCTFNALDYIVEYLYNNNPRYPERLLNPTPIFEIPFCKEWLEKHPRTAPPKWMLMSSEEAATTIQRIIRGYMVRCRPDVREMRQFWKDYRRDMEEEGMISSLEKRLSKKLSMDRDNILSLFYEELTGDYDAPVVQNTESNVVSHHSDNCIHCEAFRTFLEKQPAELIRSYAVVASPVGTDKSETEVAVKTTHKTRNSTGTGTTSKAPHTAPGVAGNDAPASTTPVHTSAKARRSVNTNVTRPKN